MAGSEPRKAEGDMQTIVVSRKRTLKLPPGKTNVTVLRPRKGIRRGSAVLKVPRGTKIENAG